MAARKVFAGAKIRALRTDRGMTQAQLAARLDISASYLNQIENNQRPLTAAVMLALAEGFALDISTLTADKSDRLLAGLREALADPVFGEDAPGLMELKTASTGAPDLAQAMLRLYEAYRKANERLSSLDNAIVDEPAGVLQTAYEEVRDFFHYANNYIDPLDRAAETVAQDIPTGRDRVTRLAAYLETRHGCTVRFASPSRTDMVRIYDRASGTLTLNERLAPETLFFQMAAQLGLLSQPDMIDTILSGAGFKTEEARAICRIGLANYFAGALQMPYGEFLGLAREVRHDLDELAFRFGASHEQVAHRLSTLQRPRANGVPFFFARVDAAGTITKRHSATPLQFARYGGACPLWNVHQAFEAHGRVIRQLAETPDGTRYLCLAWSREKRIGGFTGPLRRDAYALGCEIGYADRMVHADGLDLTRRNAFQPIGVSCRICERQHCHQRSVPPIASTIKVTPERRGVIPYEIG